VAATNLKLTLTADAPDITVFDGTALLSRQNTGDPFVFAIDEAATDSLVTLWIHMGRRSNTSQGALRLDVHLAPPGGPEGAKFLLSPCRPNPFRDATNLSFSVPQNGRAVVRIYDVSGRLVRTVDDSYREAGPHQVRWDGSSGSGDAVANGVYFVRLEVAGDSRTRKVVLLR